MMARRVRRALALLAVSVPVLAASGCGGGGDTKADGLVCGAIDPALVSAYVGSSDVTWSGSLTGSGSNLDCTVSRTGVPVLTASVVPFANSAEADRQAGAVRAQRRSMRGTCAKPVFADDWATANLCVESPTRISVVAATSTANIELILTSPQGGVSVAQATALARGLDEHLGQG